MSVKYLIYCDFQLLEIERRMKETMDHSNESSNRIDVIDY